MIENDPEISACDAMIAAAVASADQRQQRPRRRQQEERMLDVGFEQQQRALPEVVQHQRRQHQREPRQPDRMLAEVPHVGVERFAAGDDEEHGAEHRKSGEAVGDEEGDGVPRIEARQARPALARSTRRPAPRSSRTR